MFLYILPDDPIEIRQSDLDPTEDSPSNMRSVRAEELIVIRLDPETNEFQQLDANGAWNSIPWIDEL